MDLRYLLNAQHRSADVKHQRRRLIGDKCQAKHALVKRPRALGIRGGQEQDRIVEMRHVSTHSGQSSTFRKKISNPSNSRRIFPADGNTSTASLTCLSFTL